MSANFDWQTEEDDRREHAGWDDPIEKQPATPPRRPPWRLLAVIGTLLLAVGALVWWRVDRRIDETMQAVRTDVIASHNLVQRAAVEGDAEVFRSFLSGRDPAWTAGELAVFDGGLFADRAPFGLSPVEGSLPAILPAPDEEPDAAAHPADIVLSPDFSEAVVTVDQPYTTGDGQTVVLQQTTVFRRGDRRWLMAPPLNVDEFWGEWQTVEGDRLSLIYPQRDADVAIRLADDFDAAIARMCAMLEEIDCSADFYLTVRLDTDPQALADLSTPLGGLRRARTTANILELPAPSLVGLPAGDAMQQEAGYAALRDGYARHVLGAAIAQAVGWDCCEAAVYFALLLDYQFSQLGLAEAWPVGAADYRRVLDERTTLAGLGSLMSDESPAVVDDDSLWRTRVAIDFLLHSGGGRPAAELQRRLDRARGFNQFARWVLDSAGDGRPVPDDVTQAFWLYALQRAAEAETEAQPIAPDETLYLVCTAPGESEAPETSRLLRYEPAADAWTELYELEGFIWMTPLPGREQMLLQEFALASEAWRTRVWRDGDISTVFVSDANTGESAVSMGQTDPTGTQLLVYTFDPDEGDTRVLMVDLRTCVGNCAATRLAGIPYWSPNSGRALYSGDGRTYPTPLLLVNGRTVLLDSSEPFVQRPIAIGSGYAEDAASLIDVGVGYSPFWLDDETFGFIRRVNEADTDRADELEIVLATVDDLTPQTILLGSDLEQFLPDEQPRRMSLAYVTTNPQWPDKLFIVARDSLNDEAFVFLYDIATGRPELRLTLPADFNHSLGFSPDGRYLVLTGTGYQPNDPDSNLAPMLLHDIAANRTFPLLARLPYFLPSVVYDWTPDGLLAVALDENLIGLIDPDRGGVRLLGHNQGACTSVAWLG